MENLKFRKDKSDSSILQVNQKHDFAVKSSVTHPSRFAQNRNLETIFQKISNGDEFLSRIPTRLDPNIEFSDDEDESSSDEKNSGEILESTSDVFFEEKKENKNMDCSANKPKSLSPSKLPFAPYILNKSIYSKIEKSSYSHGSVSSFSSGLKKSSFTNASTCSTLSQNKSDSVSKSLQNTILYAHDLNSCGSTQEELAHVGSSKSQLRPISEKKPNKILQNFVNQKDLDIPRNSIETGNTSVEKPYLSTFLNDVLHVNGRTYNVLSLLGTGGSCKVFSVYDVQKKSVLAIKCVNLKDTDPSIRKGYQQEIEYLQKLQSSNRVITMYDYEYRENELFLVLEHGDIDFAKYISNEAKLKRLSPLMIKFYWSQMLEAVADIHKYGIVHSDLKPANFLLVAGNLKLIDFGIATSVPEDKTSTFRDTQVGTLNYMSPEAITQMSADDKQLRFKVGVKSDVWSLGCILYNLVYGTTPFHSFKSLMQKIYAITNPNHEIPFKPLPDPLLLDVLQSCLKRNPKERASVEELLQHPYLKDETVAVAKPCADINKVVKQMQDLTPRRMMYVTKVIKELSESSHS